MDRAEQVYYSLLGEFVMGNEVPGVENLFVQGSDCDRLYTQVWEANRRLCRRLGAKDEDTDVEELISACMQIQKIVALRMYAYGKM